MTFTPLFFTKVKDSTADLQQKVKISLHLSANLDNIRPPCYTISIIQSPIFPKERKQTMDRKKTGKIILMILAAAALVVLTVLLMPAVLSLREEAARAAFEEKINSLGFWGPFALLFVQILQIIVAVIPGEPIEIIAGVMYGTWGGLLLCLAGILIATIAIYYTVRHFGKNSITKVVKKEEEAKYAFLFKEKNLAYLIFILFFIPGVPKDVLVYLCPFTKIKPLHFFMIATFARIPSIVTSTWAGSNLSKGNILESVLIFAATGLLGLLGIFLHNKIIAKKERRKSTLQ